MVRIAISPDGVRATNTALVVCRQRRIPTDDLKAWIEPIGAAPNGLMTNIPQLDSDRYERGAGTFHSLMAL